MWDYVEKYGIMEMVKEAIYAMLDLFLLVVEKLIDEPIPLIIIFGVFLVVTVCLSKRLEYVSGRVYVEKRLNQIMREQYHGIIKMFIFIALFTEVMTRTADKLYKDNKPYNMSFIIYYIPMLCLVVVQRLRKVHKERKECYLKCLIYLLPGISSHILYLVLLACANKGIWIIALITVLGVVAPALLDVGILTIISPKDIKMIKIEMVNGDCYNVKYKDLIKQKNNVCIRLRDNRGKVTKAIIVKRDDVAKQTIYTLQPKLSSDKYNIGKVR